MKVKQTDKKQNLQKGGGKKYDRTIQQIDGKRNWKERASKGMEYQ